jgi:hypothetical protein
MAKFYRSYVNLPNNESAEYLFDPATMTKGPVNKMRTKHIMSEQYEEEYRSPISASYLAALPLILIPFIGIVLLILFFVIAYCVYHGNPVWMWAYSEMDDETNITRRVAEEIKK